MQNSTRHTFQKFLNKLHLDHWERRYKSLLTKVLGLLIRDKPLKAIPFDAIKKILIIRQHNELGDMLCAVPVFRALRERFPHAHISLVASHVNYEIVLHTPYLDEVLLYDRVGFFKFCKRLKSHRYDLAVVPATVSISMTSDALSYFSGARFRVGPNSLNGSANPTFFFHNIRDDLDWHNEPNEHQTERNLDLLRPLGISTSDLSVVIGLTDEEKEFGREFLERHRSNHSVAVGFHPGAGKPSHRWPADRFALLADRFASEHNALIVITAGPMDDEPLEVMISKLRSPFVLVKNFSIRQVAAIIDRLQLYVTNDTGTMHVAGATSASVLSLFGPSNPYEWAPLGEKNRFIAAKGGNLQSLSIDQVYEVAVELIEKQTTKSLTSN